MNTVSSMHPNARHKQCLCGKWFSIKPERDRYCSKPCALADSWNTLVAGESHYRREMAAREAMKAASAKRVASSRSMRTPEVATSIPMGQRGGPVAIQADYYTAFGQAVPHRPQPVSTRPRTRHLRRIPSTMHLSSLAKSQSVRPLNMFSPAPSYCGRQG